MTHASWPGPDRPTRPRQPLRDGDAAPAIAEAASVLALAVLALALLVALGGQP